MYYYKIYVFLACGYAVFCFFRAFTIVVFNFKLSKKIHEIAFNKILHSSLIQFLEKVPGGRIINRLSRDMMEIDLEIPFYIGSLLVLFYVVIGSVVVQAIISSYYIVPAFIVIFIIC